MADLRRTQSYINGQWRDATDGSTFEVHNPANARVLAQVANVGLVETREAIDAAAQAFKSWSRLLSKERCDHLMRWYQLIMDKQEDLAHLLTAEMGKPLQESSGEVRYGASFIEWFAQEGRRTYGDVIPTHAQGKRLLTLKQPVGVVGAITPWNFPIAMITRKIAPALAAGCTVVVKPSEQTPLSALALCELAEQAGIPPGVLNVLTSLDAATVGREMTANPLVRKISFTGSTAVGKLLMRQCADTVKKVSLELGGNAPFIVFDDADLDAAVVGAIASKYRNAGQTCVCTNRFYIQEGVYEDFADRFVRAVRNLQVGAGTEADVAIGPLINQQAVEKVELLVADARSKGGAIPLGGARHAKGGLFYEPTVVTQAHDQMRLAHEEIFGPVASLFRFETEAEVVQAANATRFGLAAYVYTRDVGRTWRISEDLEYGMVGVNTGLISTEVAPFGGVKESGLGREGSKYGIEDFMEIKYVCLHLT